MSGAGTGTVVIRMRRRPTLWAPLRGLAACYAAGTGAVRLGSSVPRPGSAAARTTAASTSVSVLSAPSLPAQVEGENVKAKCPGRSDRREPSKAPRSGVDDKINKAWRTVKANKMNAGANALA